MFDEVSYDYFAVSLPEIEVFQDDIALRNTQYCNYLRALGSIGLGQREKAEALLNEILEKQTDYQSVFPYMDMKQGKKMANGVTGVTGVTVQPGLRIYCADRMKLWWQQASSPSRSDFNGWMQ